MDFEAFSSLHRPSIEASLENLLPPITAQPIKLHEAMRYSVLDGGKRFRPLLCLAACRSVGGDASNALDAACAIEMVHCFSLIHDDLPSLDNDALRRGRPSCHIAYGEAIAILAGDALFCAAFEILSRAKVDPDVIVNSIRLLAEASGTSGMVGGQTMDIEAQGLSGALDEVEWIHTRKTGALIAASAAIGATLGGGRAEDIELCRSIGFAIGKGFQVADDILNLVSDEQSLGKPVLTDRDKSKLTYPSVLGLDGARRELESTESKADELIARLAHPEEMSAMSAFAFARQT